MHFEFTLWIESIRMKRHVLKAYFVFLLLFGGCFYEYWGYWNANGHNINIKYMCVCFQSSTLFSMLFLYLYGYMRTFDLMVIRNWLISTLNKRVEIFSVKLEAVCGMRQRILYVWNFGRLRHLLKEYFLSSNFISNILNKKFERFSKPNLKIPIRWIFFCLILISGV